MGEKLEFTVGGSDADTETSLIYSAEGLPQGAILNSNTGKFTWTPDPRQLGEYNIRFAVSDGEETVTQ